MFFKSVIVFTLTIGLTSISGVPQNSQDHITEQRYVYNQGGLLPGVGALIEGLTTGFNGALSGRPTYVPQNYVPMQEAQAYQQHRRHSK